MGGGGWEGGGTAWHMLDVMWSAYDRSFLKLFLTSL